MTASPAGDRRPATARGRVLLAALAVVAVLLSGCGDGRDGVTRSYASAPGAGVPPTEGRGQRLWIRHCATCHGATGDGRTLAAKRLAPSPRSLADAVTARDPRAVHASIVGGRPGTAMPAYAALLTEGDAIAIAEFVAGVIAGGAATPVRRHPGPPGAGERAIAALSSADAVDATGGDRTPPGAALAAIDARWIRATCTACHDRDGEDRKSVV